MFGSGISSDADQGACAVAGHAVGIDPGVARGGVVWCGFDRDGVQLVYDELYPEGKTVGEIAKAIKAKNRWWGIDPDFYVIDPSARNRSLVNAQSVEAEFQRNDIFPIHGQNSREAGILQLRGRLENGGLFIAENCKAVLYEAKRWLVAKDEKTSEQTASGDQFVTKGPDHTWDPIRYCAMERLWFEPRQRGAAHRPSSLIMSLRGTATRASRSKRRPRWASGPNSSRKVPWSSLIARRSLRGIACCR
jgi:hypothetical protein